jgi:hypothetical protein
MAKIEEICKNCVYWLASDRITDYGYCVKRDAYKPEFLTCERWQAKAEYLVKKEDGK